MLQYQGFSYISEIIELELISSHYNNLLPSPFDIKKTHKLVAQKYYLPKLCYNIKYYVKGFNICLTSKAVWYKLHSDLQFLPISFYYYKNLLIDFVAGLPI